VLGLLGLLALGLVIAILAMTGYTVRMLAHPPRRTYASALARSTAGDPGEVSPASGGPYRFEAWTFDSRGNILHAWDVPGRDPTGPVVVFVHGWGDSRIGALSRLPAFAALASRMVMFDLPGHGDSGGTCSLGVREVQDMDALMERIGSTHPVVLVGWSMGAGIVIAFAAGGATGSNRVAAVIAESPYRFGPTPAQNVLIAARQPHRINVPLAFACLGLQHGLGIRGFSGPGFDRALHASKLFVPLLVVHGSDDRTSPPADGKLIAQAAPKGEFLAVPDAGHHGLWTNPQTAAMAGQACEDFVARALVQRG